MKRHLILLISVLFAVLGIRAEEYELVTSLSEITSTDTYVFATLKNEKMYAVTGTSTATNVLDLPAGTTTLPQTLEIENASVKQFNIEDNGTGKAVRCISDDKYWGSSSATSTTITTSATLSTSSIYLFELTAISDAEPGYYRLYCAATARAFYFFGGTSFKNYKWANNAPSSTNNYTNLAIYRLSGSVDNREGVTLEFIDAPTSLTVGETATLSYQSTPEVSGIVFSSNNPEIATVDASGVVTAINAGEAVITAQFEGNETYKPASAFFTLKVNKPLAGNELYIEFKLGSGSGNSLKKDATHYDFIVSGADFVTDYTYSNVYFLSDNGIRLGTSNNPGSITLNLTKSYRITGITVNAVPYGSDGASISVNDEWFTPTGNTLTDYQLTYTPATLTDKISISTNKKRAYVKSIMIYFETGDEGDYVEAPQFSVEAGVVEKGTTVVLTCGTEGASIYYTLDGTTPTTESTLYTAPFTINETTTVSAIAVKEGMKNSPENKAVYTVVPVYDTLAAFIEAAPEDNAIIDAPLTVYYYGTSGNNHYLYVTDGTAKTFLWNPVGNYKNGDVIPAGVVGKYNDRLNEIEVDANSIGETTTGAAIEPTVVTEVTKEMLHEYVKIEGVTISGTTATVGDQEITLYNRFTTNFGTTIPEGENMTLVGIVNIYNKNGQSGTQGNLQVYPTEIIEPEPTEVAALTITPEFGTIYTGQEIVIDCETEGALLYGNIGDTNINGEEMPYTYTVSEEAVGKTINVSLQGKKEGLTESDELKGEFSVAQLPSLVNNNATFDWTNNEELKSFLPEDVKDNLVNATKLSGYTFTNKVIKLNFAQGGNTSGNEPTYYTSDNSLHIYQGNTMTVKLDSSVGHLDKIVFAYLSAKYSPEADKFTANCGTMSSDGTTWTPEASRAADDQIREVIFTNAGNQVRVTTTTVAYTDVPTGITAVEAAESDAPAVFYNLQGIRVNNPSGGIFIRVQGTNVDKILVK